MGNMTATVIEVNAAINNDIVSLYNLIDTPKIILICEHASNFIPSKFNNLGLEAAVLESHVAWDLGALAVAKQMAKLLSAPLIVQNISRLVYDCNRPPHSPTAMPPKSEIYNIAGNEGLTEQDKQSRVENYYVPFNKAVSWVVDQQIEQGNRPIVVTIHSFTPIYNGKARNVEIGILHDADTRFADEMLKRMVGDEVYNTQRNQPYGPEDAVTHTLKQHAQSKGLLNVMLEIRNDLIADEQGQAKAAKYLSGIVADAIAK